MTDAKDDGTAPEVTIIPPAGIGAAPDDHAQAPRADARRRRLAVWAVSLVVLAVLLVAGAPYWAPPLMPLLPWGVRPETPETNAQIAALAARLDAAEAARRDAEARVARLEAQMKEDAARSPAPPPALAALGERVAVLEHRPDSAAALAAAIAPLSDELRRQSARLDDFAARLGRVAAQSSGADAERALVLSVAELRTAVAGSAPYADALAAVTALGRGDADVEAALKPLAAAAPTGMPSAAALAERFAAETAPAILHAGVAAPTEDASWSERMLARVRTLVVIRRIGGTGDAADAAVAQAQAALHDGDLAAAVKPLKSLAGAPAEAAASWLASADERVAAEAALDRLARQLATRLAAVPAPAANGGGH